MEVFAGAFLEEMSSRYSEVLARSFAVLPDPLGPTNNFDLRSDIKSIPVVRVFKIKIFRVVFLKNNLIAIKILLYFDSSP